MTRNNRIRFFRVRKCSSLSSYLKTHLQIPESQVLFLIELGAIYCNFERVTDNINLQTGDILRCHIEPKRFLQNIDWSEHLLFENDDFLVLNKPSGLPCQPSLDNRIENVLFQASRHFKYPLFITHRLDVGTKGVMILAKNKRFQAQFNGILEARKAVKIYEALSLGPLMDRGLQHHWMRPHARAPKILSRTPIEGWKPCSLEILESQLLQNHPLHPETGSETERGINYYRLQLLTGRTHQIRAQLAFEANPLLGDTLYGGPAHKLPFEWHALQCSELSFTHDEHNYHWHLPSLISTGPSL